MESKPSDDVGRRQLDEQKQAVRANDPDQLALRALIYVDELRELAGAVRAHTATKEQRRRLRSLVDALDGADSTRKRKAAFRDQLAEDVFATMGAVCGEAKSQFKDGVAPERLTKKFVACLPMLQLPVGVAEDATDALADAFRAMFQKHGASAPTPSQTALDLTRILLGQPAVAKMFGRIGRQRGPAKSLTDVRVATWACDREPILPAVVTGAALDGGAIERLSWSEVDRAAHARAQFSRALDG